MLRDASHRQVIQKFSFIDSLNLSRVSSGHFPADLGESNRDAAFSRQQQTVNQAQVEIKSQAHAAVTASAIIPTADVATTIDTNWYQPTSDYSLSLAEIINSGADGYLKSDLTPPSSNKRSYLGKILFALACSYCLFVIWWVFGHQNNKILTVLTGGKNIVLSQGDLEFIDYMERSLEQIDREILAQKKSNESVVYVPVYTPSQTVRSNIPVAISPRSIPQQPAHQPTKTQPLPIPAPPPLPAPTPISGNSGQQIAIAPKPQVNHTLIGILELGGDRSAALVKVQGKTRRVWIGEEINTDGWLLESVGNQRAKISYQGQVKSISVGETF
ncbi:MAG: hypothetical protein AAF652_02205 [Cyanobacteria bacterium P01_C01_bin.72]